MLSNGQIGQYILQKIQDTKDESFIFQDVFDAISDELETAPLTLFNMLTEALEHRGEGPKTLPEVIENLEPD